MQLAGRRFPQLPAASFTEAGKGIPQATTMTNTTEPSDASESLPAAQHLQRRRERHLDPWRIPASASVERLIQEVVDDLLAFEKRHSIRQRARRPDDARTFRKTITAVICDLIHAHAWDLDGVMITRSKRKLGQRSRYRPSIEGKQLPAILDHLASDELGWIEQVKGHRPAGERGQLTVIRAGKRLSDLIEELEIDISDLGYRTDNEVIVLKSGGRGTKKKLLEYDDTDHTRRMRDEMEVINDWLSAAHIEVVPCIEPETTNVHERSLRRVFNYGSFDSGGRLFGGFWQGMRKVDRRAGLRIDGARTIEIDYRQLNPTLLYALAGKECPLEDAYDIPGPWPNGIHREGFKTLFNSLLFIDQPLTRKPQGTARLLPKRSVQELTRRMEEVHQSISHYFHTNIGHRLFSLESAILVRVLLKARSQGIVALPIHDAIIIPAHYKEQGCEIMKTVFKEYMGRQVKVSVC